MGSELAHAAAQQHAATAPGERQGIFRRHAKAPEATRTIAGGRLDAYAGAFTGQKTERSLRTGFRRETVQISEDLAIPESMDRQYRIFLRKHYTNLQELERLAPDILNDPRHRYDKAFLEAFKGERGRFNEEQLKEFLATQKGLEIATVLIDHQLSLREMAHGIVAEGRAGERPGGGKGDIARGYQIWKFEAMKNDDLEKRYLKIMTGLDVDDFKIVDGRVEYARTQGRQTSINPEQYREQNRSLREARTQYIRDVLGVKSKWLDASAEEWLLHNGNRQLDGLRLYNDVINKFNTQEVTIGVITSKGFKPGDDRGNLERFTRARESGAADAMEEYFTDLNLSPEAQAANKKVEALRKIAGQAGSREEVEKGKIDKKKEIHSKDKDALGTVAQPLTQEQTKVTEVTDLYKKSNSEFGISVSSVGDLTRAATAERMKIDDPGNPPPNKVTIEGRKIQALVDMRDYVDKHSTGNPSKDAAVASVAKGFYEYEIKVIQQAETDLKEQIKALEDRATEIKSAEGVLRDSGEIAKQADNANAQMQKDYKDVTDFSFSHGGTTVTISDTELQTLTVDELMQKVNESLVLRTAAGIPNPPGWGPENNNRPEHRQKILRAIAESRARTVEPSLATPPRSGPFFELTDASKGALPEGQLRRLSPEDINSKMNALFVSSGGSKGWDVADNPAHTADVEAAKKMAQERLNARVKGVEDTQTDLQEKIDRLEADKASIDYSTDANQAQVILEVGVKGSPQLNEMAGKILEEKAAFTDVTLSIASTDAGLTTAEKTPPGLPMGYLKALDEMFGYQAKTEKTVKRKKADGSGYEDVTVPTTRAEAFKDAIAFLPPADYADLMNRHLGLGITKAKTDPAFLTDVLTTMGTKIGTTLDQKALRKGILAMWDEKRDRLLASVTL